MLLLDTASLESIITFLRSYHQAPQPAQHPPTAGTTSYVAPVQNNPPSDVIISYGDGNAVIGRMQLQITQYYLMGATNNNPNGVLAPLTNVNYSALPDTWNFNYFKAAFKQAILNNDPNSKAAMFILISECCRSEMVKAAVYKLIRDKTSFPQPVWFGLQWAFKNYGSTCGHAQVNINTGRALTSVDYINYLNSLPPGTTNAATFITQINAVTNYI